MPEAPVQSPVAERVFSAAELVRLYEALLLPRLIEEKMLKLLRQGRLSKWFSGIGQEAIAVGRHVGARRGRLDPAHAPQPRRVHQPGARPAATDAATAAQGGRVHQGARPHVPLRHARKPHRRHDQPPGSDAAGRRRARARRHAARRAARGRDLHRRRFDERGRLPRGGQPCGGLETAGHLRRREQPVRVVHAEHPSSSPARTSRTRASATACPGSSSTATTCSPCTARSATRPLARGPASAPRCWSARRSACAGTRRRPVPTTCRASCSRSGPRRTPSCASSANSTLGGASGRGARGPARPAQAHD